MISVNWWEKKNENEEQQAKGEELKSLESVYRVERADEFHVPTLPSKPLNSKAEQPAESSPLQYFLSLLFRDLDSQVTKRLYNLLGINTACKDKPESSSTPITS